MQLTVKACSFAIMCAVAGVVIKQLRPDYSILIRVAGSVAIASFAITAAEPIIAFIRSLIDSEALGGYGSVMIKALAVAILAELCSEICRDCGETSVALGVELVGKLEILIMALPLLGKLLETVREVLSMG